MSHETQVVRTAKQRFDEMLKRRQQTPMYQTIKLQGQVADLIFDAMKEQGVSKAEMARRLGVSRAYVTQLLRGGENMTLETITRVACVLGCDVQVSLKRKEAKP